MTCREYECIIKQQQLWFLFVCTNNLFTHSIFFPKHWIKAMYTLSVFGTDNHWTFLIWIYCTYDLIKCSAALKVTLVTARNSTSYLSLAFSVLTNFTSSFFFFKVIYRKPRSGRTLPQKKTPKNRFHKEKKDSISCWWMEMGNNCSHFY